jgi:6-phosphogluconolactonase (cycloisomerase 2 family)
MAMKSRALLGLLVVTVTMSLAGCGHYVCHTTFGGGTCTPSGGGIGTGGGGSKPAAAFAYFVNPGTIGAILDTSGNFGLIPNYTPPLYTVAGSYANLVIVQKQWIYEPGSLAIEAYAINGTTGMLSLVSGQPFSSANAYRVAADPAGKFLFATGANNDSVTVFSINQSSGALTLVGSYSTGIGFAAQATTDGLGKFLYVTAGNLGTSVAVFSIGATGALTPVGPQGISIAELKSEPTGKFLLGVTGNGANNGIGTDTHIYVYSINQSTGLLSPAAGSPFTTTYIPGNLAVHPNGNLVYTFNYSIVGPSPMEGFSFNSSTGALTELTGSPFTSFSPYDGAFDESGTYLFIHSTDSIAVTSVDGTTGALASVGQALTGTGNVAWGVTDPH